uniref:DDE-1 domain-containing protein n=1 Tax=Molossus molossus TaxID=27622 RepID=A0A7J8C8E0_MOLMO|nr:hypothetical protein HJG59_009849 [Molossus molossus]
MKLKVNKDYEGGKSVMVIVQQSGMAHSTIATILKNKNKVMGAVKGSASLKTTRLTKIREGPISDMEKFLLSWIEDQTQKCIPLRTMMITAKAENLFAMTFILKEDKLTPTFKAFRDRITVSLGGSVTGYKWKLFVIWHSESPRAFKHISKHTLPVYYRSNKKLRMTQLLFQDALLDCYASEMEKYCLENNIPFKILLIVDNAPRHPPFIDLHPNIKVVFLPSDTTSLIQPMDQGVIAAFKAYYWRRTFAQAIAAIEEDPEKTLMQFWKDYNIYDCIKNLAWAWDDVTKECMSGIWKQTLKRFVHD